MSDKIIKILFWESRIKQSINTNNNDNKFEGNNFLTGRWFFILILHDLKLEFFLLLPLNFP